MYYMSKLDLREISQVSNIVSAAFNPTLTEVPRMTGTVKWWDSVKGYGFLVEDETQRDVFVHWQQMWYDKTKNRPRFELAEGQRVEFEVREEAKGLQAFEVVVLAD